MQRLRIGQQIWRHRRLLLSEKSCGPGTAHARPRDWEDIGLTTPATLASFNMSKAEASSPCTTKACPCRTERSTSLSSFSMVWKSTFLRLCWRCCHAGMPSAPSGIAKLTRCCKWQLTRKRASQQAASCTKLSSCTHDLRLQQALLRS